MLDFTFLLTIVTVFTFFFFEKKNLNNLVFLKESSFRRASKSKFMDDLNLIAKKCFFLSNLQIHKTGREPRLVSHFSSYNRNKEKGDGVINKTCMVNHTNLFFLKKWAYNWSWPRLGLEFHKKI